MAGFYTHGPTLTYVTDPALSIDGQQRVLRAFIGCAGDQMLRVAFRLPDVPDHVVQTLLEWYLREVDEEGLASHLLPPLVHNRPAITRQQPGTGRWLPAKAIGVGAPADAYSVHSVDEAVRAVAYGASEVMFGHVFASGSHPGVPGLGVEHLKEVVHAIRRDINEPIVTAIGGIDRHTMGEIGRARVFNVACIRAISRSSDIASTLAEIRSRWVTALIDEDLNDPNPLAFDRLWGIWHRWTADGRM